MKALVTPEKGAPFHLWWEGMVVADSGADVASSAVALLNGEMVLPMSRANLGGTDNHWTRRGRLRTRDDFLLTVGSLVDRLDGILTVDLVGDGDAIHESLLDNRNADKSISEQAIERAMRSGMSREQAERLYR